MKKLHGIIAVLLIAFCYAMPAQAQIKFGIKGGLNLSKVTFSNEDLNGKNKTGFFIGPMAELTLPIVGLGVDVAVLYSERSIEVKNTEGTLKNKSISIPLNLKWTIGLGSTTAIYIAGGPQYDYNLDSDKDILKLFQQKDHTMSFNLGAGVKLLKHLQVGVNYNFGLSDIGEYKLKDILSTGVKQNTWQLSAAYIF